MYEKLFSLERRKVLFLFTHDQIHLLRDGCLEHSKKRKEYGCLALVSWFWILFKHERHFSFRKYWWKTLVSYDVSPCLFCTHLCCFLQVGPCMIFKILMLCRYGPFWICTTLIFVAASIGTFVTYIAHKLKKKEWDYDINLVTWSAGVFYGYVTVVPLALYVVLKYFSAPSGLVQLFCLYGYSLFVFIPALVSFIGF